MRFLLLAASLAFPQQMIDLNCMEGLVAIERAELAGVFSFIDQKDASHAFADLLAHDKKAFKKFVAKAEKDLKRAQAITQWDHEVLLNVISLYGSPIAPTLDDPGDKLKNKANELSVAPTATLEAIASKRKA